MELVTVIIVCYKNFSFIYETIESVLKQTYSNIELIISDDGSDNFPKENIESFIYAKKQTNISNVIIYQEDQNCGTVKHLNNTIKLSSGEYIITLAADDALYDEHVIQRYVEGFTGSECYIEMAQTAMYDYSLKKLMYYFLNGETKEALINKNYDKLYTLLAMEPCLPTTSTCYKRLFFEKFGEFDENYSLIEDWPMHLKLVRDKWEINYVDFIAIKHREGGISHGAVGHKSDSKYRYYKDMLQIQLNEIKPNYSYINEKYIKKVKMINKIQKAWYEEHMFMSKPSFKLLFSYIAKNPSYALKKILYKVEQRLGKKFNAALIIFISLLVVNPIIKEAIRTIFLSDTDKILYFENIFNVITLIGLGLGLLMLLMKIITKILKKLEEFPDYLC